MKSLVRLVIVGLLFTACGLTPGPPTLGERISSSGWSVGEIQVGPDGESVAFTGTPTHGYSSSSQLVLAGRPPTVIGSPGWNVRAFAWMPGGDSLLVAYAKDLSQEVPNEFAIVGRTGEVIRHINIDRAQFGASGLAVSPDGRTALFPASDPGPFDEAETLWRLDLNTGRTDSLRPASDGEFYGYPIFIGDNSAIITGGAAKATGPRGWLGIVSLTTGEIVRLSTPGQVVGEPTVTPDLKHVVYSSFPTEDRARGGLWTIDLRKPAAPRLLASTNGQFPQLLPGARQALVVQSGPPVSPNRIQIVDLPADFPLR